MTHESIVNSCRQTLYSAATALLLSLCSVVPVAAADGKPATIEEAVRVLDLTQLPLPEGTEEWSEREISGASYQTTLSSKDAYRFHQAQLAKLGWKEIPGTMLEETYASGSFEKSGFVLSVTASVFSEGKVLVALTNMGNIPANDLPVISGVKTVFANASTAIYSIDRPLKDVAEETRQLLLKNGWTPYGEADGGTDQRIFTLKQNAIQLNVMVSIAPAQENQTSIMLNPTLLSADIPAPSDAADIRFTGSNKTLTFETTRDFGFVGKFYQNALAKQGWKSTAEDVLTAEGDFGNPVGIMVFKNPADDRMSLDLLTRDNQTEVSVRHQTKAEWQAEEQKSRQAAEKQVAEQKADEERRKAEKEAFESSVDSEITADADREIEMALEEANAAIADALKNLPGKAGKRSPAKSDRTSSGSTSGKGKTGPHGKTPKSPSTKQSPSKTSEPKTSSAAPKSGSEKAGGTLRVGSNTFELKHLVAYETRVFDEKSIRVYLTEKPANTAKLKASLKKNGNDDDFNEFQPQVRLDIDADGKVTGFSLWADNVSASSNANLEGTAEISGGRISGSAKMTAPADFFDKDYIFDVHFEGSILPLPEGR